MKVDKDFKEANNYREVECCGNCKYAVWGFEWVEGCCINITLSNQEYGHCDKWEHE